MHTVKIECNIWAYDGSFPWLGRTLHCFTINKIGLLWTDSLGHMVSHIIVGKFIIRTRCGHHVEVWLLSLTMQRNVSHAEYPTRRGGPEWFISKDGTWNICSMHVYKEGWRYIRYLSVEKCVMISPADLPVHRNMQSH